MEGKPGETAETQDKKLTKYYKRIYRAGGPHRPDEGLMGCEWWRLVTPSGQVFVGYSYAGDDNWLAMFRDFAAAEGRAIALIEDFDTLVIDGGERVPISACKSEKVTASG